MVDMGVDVDQPRRHDGPADVLDPAGTRRERLAHRRYPARLDGDVEHVVDAVALVEDAAAFQDEIVALCGRRFTHRYSPVASAGDRRAACAAPPSERSPAQASSTTRFSLIDCSAASTIRRLFTAASIDSREVEILPDRLEEEGLLAVAELLVAGLVRPWRTTRPS